VTYEDGDSEELCYDRVAPCLITEEEYQRYKKDAPEVKSKFEDCTWPPPGVSVRHIISGSMSSCVLCISPLHSSPLERPPSAVQAFHITALCLSWGGDSKRHACTVCVR
jgi:hypothetical protein